MSIIRFWVVCAAAGASLAAGRGWGAVWACLSVCWCIGVHAGRACGTMALALALAALCHPAPIDGAASGVIFSLKHTRAPRCPHTPPVQER